MKIPRPRVLCTALVLCQLLLAALPARGSEDYDIRESGAKGDGVTYDTEAIQKAVDRAAAAGGGVVRVPAGRFLTRRLRLRSQVTLHLAEGAELLGPSTPEDYQGLHHLIYAMDAENIAITGPGRIDGRAGDTADNGFWDVGPARRMTYPKKEATRKAALIFMSFRGCRNVRLEDVRVVQSPGWTVLLEDCQGVRVRNVELRNSVYGPNTDGFDIVNSRDVTLTDCKISTCDDAVVLKSDREDGSCSQVTVSRCELITPSYGFKIGTETAGVLKEVRFSDSTIRAPDARGIRGAVALCSVDGARVSDILISNIKVEGARAALFLRLGNRGRGLKEPKPGSLTDIRIERFTATRPAAGDWSSAVAGLPGHPIRNVSLKDVEIHVQGGRPAAPARREIGELADTYPDAQMFGDLPSFGFYARHVENFGLSNVRVICSRQDGRPAIFCEDVRGLSLAPFVTGPAFPREPGSPSNRVVFQGPEPASVSEEEKDGAWILTTPAADKR